MKVALPSGILRALSFCVPFALALSAASASVITGVTATTTVGDCCGRPLVNMVNGPGLSSYDPSASHDASSNWLSTSKTGTIDFDLHGLFARASGSRMTSLAVVP